MYNDDKHHTSLLASYDLESRQQVQERSLYLSEKCPEAADASKNAHDILLNAILNELIIFFLCPSEIRTLTLTSRALNAHIKLNANLIWRQLLTPEYRHNTMGALLTAQEAAALFATNPNARLPRYLGFGSAGRDYLTDLAEREHLNTHQTSALLTLSRPYPLSYDVVQLARLASPMTNAARLQNLVNQGKSLAAIEKIIAADILKASYRLKANSIKWHSSYVVGLLMLDCCLFALTRYENSKLNQALGNYDGNLPYTPNQMTSLIFTDYCEVMSNDYDTSNCDDIKDHYQRRFQWYGLALWVAIYFLQEYIALNFRSFAEHIHYDPAVIRQYMSPQHLFILTNYIYPSTPRAPAQWTGDQYPQHSDLHNIDRAGTRISAMTSIALLSLSSWIIGVAGYTFLRVLMSEHNIHELFKDICVNQNGNVKYAWEDCKEQKYDGYTDEPIYAFCSDDLCDEILATFPRGPLGTPLGLIAIAGWFVLLIELSFISYWINKDVFSSEISESKFALFSRSVDPEFIIHDQLETDIDSAIARTVTDNHMAGLAEDDLPHPLYPLLNPHP